MSDVNSERPQFDDFELLTEVSQLLTILDLDGILNRVVDLVIRLVGARRASLFLFDEGELDKKHLILTNPQQDAPLVSQVLKEGLAAWVVHYRQPTIVDDVLTDARWLPEQQVDQPARSAMSIPFVYENTVVALLTVVHEEPKHFTKYHLRMITALANQAIGAIRQAQSFHKLQNQQRQLEGVLHTIPDAILVLDDKGAILMANSAALPLLGNTAPEFFRNRLLIELTELDSALHPVQEIMREIGDSPLRPGTQWSFETRSENLKKDLQVSIAIWEDITQSMGGYVITMHDITQLRDLHRFKDEMLRVASHDLRSPLSLIIGYTDMISLDLGDPDSPIQGYLEVIRRSTERMNGLLDDLLRVERIRTSPLELHERVDPQKLIRVVLVNMRPFANEKKQRFESSIQLDGLEGIMADPVLIRQAMENLIGNAIKYTPEYGRILVRSYVEGGYFYFSVEDNGMGIPKDAIPHIFDSFYRVRSRKMVGIKGTGLGLSLVKTVIERHNGEIWVESEEQHGSTFTFRIPI